jgi:hypothetical protein
VTFTEIVSRAAERLNLTSADAVARLGRFVNDRYARLTSSLGLQTSRRTTVTAATSASTATLTFSVEKIERVYATTSGARRMLDEITYDEWVNCNVHSNAEGTPQRYAIKTNGASSVTIVLDPVPSGIETLTADGMVNASALSGSNVPAFPADFHDALVFGALADEYDKLDRPAQATKNEALYQARVSDLRFFLAKSGYLSIKQGNSPRVRRWNPRIVP